MNPLSSLLLKYLAVSPSSLDAIVQTFCGKRYGFHSRQVIEKLDELTQNGILEKREIEIPWSDERKSLPHVIPTWRFTEKGFQQWHESQMS